MGSADQVAWHSLRLARGFSGGPEDPEKALLARKFTALHEADIAEAEARIAIAKATAAAAAQKAAAEADAAAKKATAEADAAANKATEAAALAAWAAWQRTWRFRAFIAAGIALVLDYIWHDNETVIKWYMKRKLLSCALPSTVPAKATPEVRLETGQPLLQLSFLPTVLLGPTGCGKSTALKDLARACIDKGTPTVLIGVRMPSKDKHKGTDLLPAREATLLMDATALKVYNEVGFPARRSILGMLVDAVTDLLEAGKKVLTAKLETNEAGALKASAEGTATLAPSAIRLKTCFTYLFEVVKDVSLERQAKGKSELEAAPVLLFDELEDLVKDDRLANTGGRLLLAQLAVLFVSYGVDHEHARIGFAGSSAELCRALPSPLTSSRMLCAYQADPTRESMLEALCKRGYTPEAANSMVSLCGTRLRLFQEPLRGETAPPADTFMSRAIASAAADFRGVMKRLPPADKARFAALLDKVKASYTGGPAVVDNAADIFPTSAALIDLARILFVDDERVIKFQSDLHRNVWKTEHQATLA